VNTVLEIVGVAATVVGAVVVALFFLGPWR